MDFIFGGSSGGGGTPGGSDTQVQFNDSGAFGASANFTWDDTNKTAVFDRDVAGTYEAIKLVNEYDSSLGRDTAVAGYYFNGTSQYKGWRIRGGRWTNGANFGQLHFDIGGNNQWGLSRASLDVNGLFRAVTVSADATVGVNSNIVSMHHASTGTTPGTGTQRHGFWAKDHLDLRFRASGNDVMILTWDQRFAVGTDNRNNFTGKFGVLGTSATMVTSTFKAAASQTANLTEWQDSSGRTASHIGLDGIKFNVDSVFPNSYVTIQKLRNNSVPFTEGYGGQGIGISHNVGGNPVGGLYVNSSGQFIIENSTGSKIRFSHGNLVLMSAIGVSLPGSNFQPQIRLDNSSGGRESGWYVPSFGSEKMIGTVSRTDMFTVMKENVNVGDTSATGARFIVNTKTASSVGQIVKGSASQTANLQEWQDSAGTAQSYVDANGNFVMPNLPTSDPSVAGALYVTAGGTLKVSAG